MLGGQADGCVLRAVSLVKADALDDLEEDPAHGDGVEVEELVVFVAVIEQPELSQSVVPFRAEIVAGFEIVVVVADSGCVSASTSSAKCASMRSVSGVIPAKSRMASAAWKTSIGPPPKVAQPSSRLRRSSCVSSGR